MPKLKMIAPFQPIADIGKDFIDTFKPYKSKYHAKRDFLQPLRGIENIAKGIATLVRAPLFFLVNIFRGMFRASSLKDYLSRLAKSSYEMIFLLVEGVVGIVRGVTQIAATPLTWFIKMPLRALITAIKGAPRIEQNAGIRRLVAEADTCGEGRAALVDIYYALIKKSLKAAQRGQKTAIEFFDPASDLSYQSVWSEVCKLNKTEEVKAKIDAFRDRPGAPAVTPNCQQTLIAVR